MSMTSLLWVACLCWLTVVPSSAAAAAKEDSTDLVAEDPLVQMRKALPLVGRMLKPAMRSALASLSNYVGYNALGALAVLVSTFAAAFYWFPGVLNYVGLQPAFSNRTEDSIMAQFDSILRRYNVDSDACLKVAMCSVGRLGGGEAAADQSSSSAKKERRQAGPIEVFDSMLSLTFMDEVLLSKGLRSARQVGEAGGDCDSFNKGDRCPFNAAAWKVLLATLNRSLT
ncbi:unnamed protein product [Ixodes pacificus]